MSDMDNNLPEVPAEQEPVVEETKNASHLPPDFNDVPNKKKNKLFSKASILPFILGIVVGWVSLVAISFAATSGDSTTAATNTAFNETASTFFSSETSAASEASSSSAVTTTETTKKGFVEGTLANLGSFESVTQSGSGDSVIDLPEAGAPCLINISYEGDGNFVVKSLNSSGDSVDLLVNTIGSYSGTVTTYMDFADCSMLSIGASGNWTVTMSPISTMQPLENGATYTGDDVRYIDIDALTKINLTNDGSGNFVVRGIGLSDADLLVNTIGGYNGTVIWNQEQSFLIVHSDGNWSVSW